jgi:hypothetical protein
MNHARPQSENWASRKQPIISESFAVKKIATQRGGDFFSY